MNRSSIADLSPRDCRKGVKERSERFDIGVPKGNAEDGSMGRLALQCGEMRGTAVGTQLKAFFVGRYLLVEFFRVHRLSSRRRAIVDLSM